MRKLLAMGLILASSVAFSFEGPASKTVQYRGVAHYEPCDVFIKFDAHGRLESMVAIGKFNRYAHAINKYYLTNESKYFDARGLPVVPVTGYTPMLLPIPYGEIIGGVKKYDRQARLSVSERGLWSVTMAFDELFSNALFTCSDLKQMN